MDESCKACYMLITGVVFQAWRPVSICICAFVDNIKLLKNISIILELGPGLHVLSELPGVQGKWMDGAEKVLGEAILEGLPWFSTMRLRTSKKTQSRAT